MAGLRAGKHADRVGSFPVSVTCENFPTTPVLTKFAAHIMRVQFADSKTNEHIGIHVFKLEEEKNRED